MKVKFRFIDIKSHSNEFNLFITNHISKETFGYFTGETFSNYKKIEFDQEGFWIQFNDREEYLVAKLKYQKLVEW